MVTAEGKCRFRALIKTEMPDYFKGYVYKTEFAYTEVSSAEKALNVLRFRYPKSEIKNLMICPRR